MRDDVSQLFPSDLSQKFEFYSYRNAGTVLAHKYAVVFKDLVNLLCSLNLSTQMIRMPGGNKGPIVKHIEGVISEQWKSEARISADLKVTIDTKKPKESFDYINEGYLDGHQIDFLFDRVALDIEWNSKDQTFDRDLYALSTFYSAGAIDVGVIITRGTSIDDGVFLKSLGKTLNRDGTEGSDEVYSKFGASTTNMNKLLYRLDAGRNGGCPVLVIGLCKEAFS
ncbi:MAG: BglII/BstYI family type II restriction endonuclease [Pseudomonadota bacterium]